MKVKLVTALTELISQGKSQDEIAVWLADEKNAATIEDLATEDMTEAVSKAFSIVKQKQAIDAGFKAAENLDKKSAEDAALKNKIADGVKSAMLEMKIPHGFESIGKSGFQIVEDNTWRHEFKRMIIAIASKDYATARELSTKFEKGYRTKATLRGDSVAVLGHTVPEEWDSQIGKIVTANFAVLSQINERQTSGDTLNVNAITIPSVTWVTNQDTAFTESNPASTQAALLLKDLGAYCNISNDLLEDSASDVSGETAEVFAEAVGRELSKQYLVGNDASPDSDPYDGVFFFSGVNNYDCGGTLDYADFISALGQVDGRAIAGASWFMNFRMWGKCLGMVGSDGHPIIKTDPVTGGPKFLFGFPIIISEDIPNTMNGTTDRSTGSNQSCILFGNLKQYFKVAVKGGLRIALSEHIRFTQNQVQMRVLKRTAWGAPSTLHGAFMRMHSINV